MTDFPSILPRRTVAMPVPFLAALQREASGNNNHLALDSVRDAGYHAGVALYEWFGQWLAERGESSPDKITHQRFVPLVSQFFLSAGWGSLRFESLSDAIIAVDVDEWSEPDGSAAEGSASDFKNGGGEGEGGSGRPISTGIFAGFFGQIADAPISVLEVADESASASPNRARFLLGSVDALAYVHEAMTRGIPYDRAAASA